MNRRGPNTQPYGKTKITFIHLLGDPAIHYLIQEFTADREHTTKHQHMSSEMYARLLLRERTSEHTMSSDNTCTND